MKGVYDNPDTMCREIYANGFIVTFYTEQELNSYFRRTPVQDQFLSYAKGFGPFREGAKYGNLLAIPEDTSIATPYDDKFTIG